MKDLSNAEFEETIKHFKLVAREADDRMQAGHKAPTNNNTLPILAEDTTKNKSFERQFNRRREILW